MRTLYKSLLLIFAGVAAVYGYFVVFGIRVEATSESFVERAGMPLIETDGGSLRARLHPTPAKWPSEARTIYRAAQLGIPVQVTVPDGSGAFSFLVTGLSAEHDFFVPCESKPHCVRVLESTGFRVPPEFSSSP
jgi:hypothetical protein